MTDRKPRVALLIDADNLSGDVIDQAIEHLLRSFGAIHFRRAYSSPQKVMEHMELFKRHNVRPMVNVPTGKNSTDIALAVDAIDLALSERPDVVVIASSDSDYAPLAQRLREKGCRVLGIGQAGKTGSDSPLAYDEFIDLAHRPARGPAHRPVQRPARREAVAELQPVAPATKQPVAKPSTRQPPRAVAPTAALPGEVSSILAALPALRDGSTMPLSEAGEGLRRHGILTSKSASPSRFLKRYAEFFELLPTERPRTVRLLK